MDQFNELNTLFEAFGLPDEDNVQVCLTATESADQDEWGDESELENYGEIGTSGVIDRIQHFVEFNAEDEQHSVNSDPENEANLTGTVCSCRENCLEKMDTIQTERHILSLRKMEKDQKDVYIMGSLLRYNREETRNGKRKRIRYRFTHKGITVCKGAFCKINDIGIKTVKALQTHLSLNGAVPRVHGNTGKKPHHALRFVDVKFCVDFVNSYAELNGLPMPAAPKGRNEASPILLPSDVTKTQLHTDYSKACDCIIVRTLGLTSFKDVWKHCLPHIKIMSPREDVCHKCETTRKRIAAATTECDKLDAATTLRNHIQDAQRERQQYRESVLQAVEEIRGYERPAGPVPPLSTDFTRVHYTFDYSQNVALPNHSQQMGPLFFVTRRKVQIFGVRIDSVPHQYNYLIDEDQTIGSDGTGTHGPNSVLSMLHHSLFRYGLAERACVMHADNCGGQNKNRYLMAYLCWRIHQGLHTDITLQMQIPGHTKCLVDAGFGHIKKLFRRSDCDSLGQLADIVHTSAYSNTAVLFRAGNGEENWTWYDWKSFLKDTFLPLKGIRKYHVFRFTDADKRAVYLRECSGGREERVGLVKEGIDVIPDMYPEHIRPPGLTMERQNYFYKNVRKYVRPGYEDKLCPVYSEE